MFGDTITLSAAPFAQIRYTTNGWVPTPMSPQCIGPITLTGALRLTVAAFHPDWTTSQTVTAVFTPRVTTPSFSPDGGAYGSEQRITIANATPGATIRYTNNGQDPGINDPIVANGGTVPVGNYLLKARAFADSLLPSDVKSAEYSRTDDACRYTMSPLVVSAGPAAGGGILTIAASAAHQPSGDYLRKPERGPAARLARHRSSADESWNYCTFSTRYKCVRVRR